MSESRRENTTKAPNVATRGIARRDLLGAVMAGAGLVAGTLPTGVRAQSKPDRLGFVGLFVDWRRTVLEDVAPAFEKQTGIKIDFTFLPLDALAARLKAQLTIGSTDIDVAQFSADYGWIGPYMADHDKLAEKVGMKDSEYNWKDFFPAALRAFTVDGKLIAIPYRYASLILHYQPDVLSKAGINRAPQIFSELQDAAIAVTTAGGGTRYGLGMYGKEANALVAGFLPFLFSSGGKLYDTKTWEILINKPEGVAALDYYASLASKYKVVPPEFTTWEWDGLTAGGQADRFGMCVTIAPYATLLDDPKLSKTAGRWAWTTVPGMHSPQQSLTQSGGWAFGVPASSKNPEWAAQFIKLTTNYEFMLRSALAGNSPPRTSVMTNPELVKKVPWAPAMAAQHAVPLPEPADPMYQTLEAQLRPHLSRAILGEDAKDALDAAASDWQRSLRRANLIK